MRKNRTLCPAVSARDYSSSWSTATIPCVPDDRCACADSSFVRELVNVTLEGLSCYACEPRRPPACTEDTDQCTPEACECADSRSHVKQVATTTSGTLCHFCEPIGGFGSRFGLSEVAIIAMLVSLVFICQWGGKTTSSGLSKGSLRLSRRQGDRSRAIKVHQESVGYLEECLFIVGDVFDALIAGSCDLAGCLWNSLCFVCGLVASILVRLGSCAGTTTSKMYIAIVQYGQRFQNGATHGARAITNKTVSKDKLELASAQQGKKATASGVRKRGGRKDSKVCNVADTDAGPPASPPQDAPRTQERVVCNSGSRSRDNTESKAHASRNSMPARHHSTAPANAGGNSRPARPQSAAPACEIANSTPMRHQSATAAPPPATSTLACGSKSSTPMSHQPVAEACDSESTPVKHEFVTEATELVDDSSAAHEDNSSRLESLSGDVVEPSLRRLSTDCPQVGVPQRVDGAVNLTPLRTFLGEPVPMVGLRRTASDSDLTLYN